MGSNIGTSVQNIPRKRPMVAFTVKTFHILQSSEPNYQDVQVNVPVIQGNNYVSSKFKTPHIY